MTPLLYTEACLVFHMSFLEAHQDLGIFSKMICKPAVTEEEAHLWNLIPAVPALLLGQLE